MTTLYKLFRFLMHLLRDDAPLGRISRQRAERIAIRNDFETHPSDRGEHWRE